MYNLEINPNWNFKEVVEHLKALKCEYEDILRFFHYYDLHEQVEFKRRTRDAFYALNLEEWEKDKIWDYMNGFEFHCVLRGIASRRK